MRSRCSGSRRSGALTACAVALLALSGAAQGGELEDALAAALEAYGRFQAFSGAVLVARGDDVIFSGAVGLADREWGIESTLDTRYQLGSVTKPMVATLALSLAEEGLLDLDEVVAEYVPEYPADPGERITLRHLLTHTSGIPGYGYFENPREDVFRRRYTRAEYLAVFQDLPLAFEPGTGFEYSGFGYYLLGAALERAGDAELPELLRVHVFEPAGMGDSTLDTGLPSSRRAQPYLYDYARASYRRADDRDPTTAFATGDVVSTVGDLLRFRRAFATGRLLSAESVALMSSPVRGDYGYGWVVSRMAVDDGRGSVPVLYHDGGIGGFTANLLAFPDEDLTVVVLSNTRGFKDTALPWVLAGIAHGDRESVSGLLGKRLYERTVREGLDAALEELGRARQSGRDAAVELGLDHADTLAEAGRWLLRFGRAREALAFLDLNLESFPESAATWALQGDAYAALGRLEEAAVAYEACLDLDPAFPGAVDALAALEEGRQAPPGVLPESAPFRLHDRDDEELYAMFRADQELRHSIDAGNLREALKRLRAVDASHRAALLRSIQEGRLETPYDYLRASILFQHQATGSLAGNAQVGLELALLSMRLGCEEAPLAVARAYDRFLVDLGRGQRFGTQRGPSGELRAFDDSIVAIGAAMRRLMGVPPLPGDAGR